MFLIVFLNTIMLQYYKYTTDKPLVSNKNCHKVDLKCCLDYSYCSGQLDQWAVMR